MSPKERSDLQHTVSPHWITTREAAEISGYHINYIRRLIRQGKIAAEADRPYTYSQFLEQERWLAMA